MKSSDFIYLDHAAATPVSNAAFEAMQPYFDEFFFNPSAPYLPAKRVREVYEDAKNRLAHTIGAKGVDLVITGGATESINLAFTACHSRALVLATEHKAVLEAARAKNAANMNGIKNQAEALVEIKVDRKGIIDLKDLRAKITDDVDYISIALANNELGSIQPLAEVAEIIKEIKQDRYRRGVVMPLYLHSDASQAMNLIDINVARLGADLLTINAAKCGGPKGVGALYISHGVRLQPINYGGGQEMGLRSGTENVPGVVGFAVAAEDSKKHLSFNRKKYVEMQDILKREIKQIGKEIFETESGENYYLPEPIFLGNPKKQLANFVTISFNGLDAERLIYMLEAKGIYVSTGAACAASKGEKSHVLSVIGLSDDEIAGSLRISLGSLNNIEQIKKAAQIIRETVVKEYRRVLSKTTNSSIISQNAEKVNKSLTSNGGKNE